MKNLVIVESPTKARTLAKYLGDDYQVEASMGHIRDLPKSDLGVDVEHNFEPKYVVPRDKLKRVNEFKKVVSGAQTLWLATDPDREGEAIAWHLLALVNEGKGSHVGGKKRKPNTKAVDDVRRVVFHEITPEAVKEAFENPRRIDQKLVDAQQARRVLDRLVGYKLSPLLWKKVKSGLSAGRVQSVAVRLIVDREREIEAFKATEYWSIEAKLKSQNSRLARLAKQAESAKRANLKGNEGDFIAALVEKDGKKLGIKNQEEAEGHVKFLEKASYRVEKVTKKEVRKYPAPPFTTSTLQQTASLKLGLSAKKTMMLAQVLYEHGLITYMRTDSFNLSPQAILMTRDYISTTFSGPYLPHTARTYKTKSKSAQEAHEAIRPTNVGLDPEKLKTMEGMTRDHARLYDLIWKRMVACQMAEAIFDAVAVEIKAWDSVYEMDSAIYKLRAAGSTVKFEGWLKIYGEKLKKTATQNLKIEENEDRENEEERVLPELSENEGLNLLQLLPGQHFTEPPPRFNEASIIKKLEELGIGRPSTYAPIISTIQDRFYIEKKERKFFPTVLGRAVTDFLVKFFPGIVDYDFTAEMETALDEIAEGVREWQPVIRDFYQPFEKRLAEVDETAEKVKMPSEVTDKICPECGKNLVVKFGKFGKFLACSGFPDCKHTENMEERVDAVCPDCGGQIVMRKTRKGRPFYGCKNWPTCKFASWTKPKK